MWTALDAGAIPIVYNHTTFDGLPSDHPIIMADLYVTPPLHVKPANQNLSSLFF